MRRSVHCCLVITLFANPAFTSARAAVPPCDLVERRAELFRRASIAEDSRPVVSTLPTLFAPDGIYITPGLLSSRGPKGARAWLERDTLNRTSRARMVTVGGGVSSSGDDGFTYGYLDLTRANGETLPGWYHAYWRRAGGGNWEIVAIARRRRPEGAMTPARDPGPIAKPACLDPGASADTLALARTIAAADAVFSDSAATSVGAAFAAFATPDVAKSGKESGYVFGRAEIGRLFDPPPPIGLRWKPELASAARGGDLGFTIGVAGPRDGTPLAEGAAATGHYFTIWRREPDGSWRYVID
jgi:ketosteroid isomerase-like protein